MRFRNTLAAGFVAVAFPFVGQARAAVLELRPELNVPASCNVSPVYGSDTGPALPWIDAQPARVSRIRLTLGAKIGPHGTYLPLAAEGAVVLISAPFHHVTINGRRVSGPEAKFSALLVSGAYQRLSIPAAGCWKLRLTAGSAVGYMTVWVEPEAD